VVFVSRSCHMYHKWDIRVLWHFHMAINYSIQRKQHYLKKSKIKSLFLLKKLVS
jgi:hypothetical protein